MFLKNNSRYRSLFSKSVYDYRGWAIGLQKAGYATATTYASALIGFIDSYRLYDINGGVKLRAGKTVVITRKATATQKATFVAGCGALGNEVVKNLALFGVGHIYVVDFDKIELSNLTRSVLFREEDAYNHAYKAEIVAKRASEINPQIEAVPIVGNLFSDVGFGPSVNS